MRDWQKTVFATVFVSRHKEAAQLVDAPQKNCVRRSASETNWPIPLPRAEQVAHFINHPAEALRGIKVVEAQGRMSVV